jgi:hypothetical protein
VSVALISTGRGVFIGVQGGVTDLVKSITCQVVAAQPSVDISYAASQAYEIINVARQREYSLGIVFIFFQVRKDLYRV